MNWLYYLLEANLYLLIFYGFYRLFLHNETFYNSNRYYLLFTSITAFALPVLQLGFLKPSVVDEVAFNAPIAYTAEELARIAAMRAQEGTSFSSYLYPIYLIVAFAFAIKLGMSLFKIVKLWLKANRKNTGSFTLIELKDEVTAFSFFNLLFISPALAEKQAVVTHELVHIKQKHSLDVLFFEILQIICWFNPILYFLKKDIKLLHEYIADELTTNSSMQKHEYALFLIENSFGIIPTPLTNQIFNQSILKRRINMLNKKRTAAWARLRLLLAIPLVAAMLCASTVAFSKDYGYVDLLPEKSNTTLPIQEVPKVENIKKQETPKVENIKRLKVDQVKFPPPIPNQHVYVVRYRKNKTGDVIKLDQRYVVINGEPVADQEGFSGVGNTKSVKYLTEAQAIKKYGTEKGKYGAVEITGTDLKYGLEIAPPPPIENVKFPPPAPRPNKTKKPLKKAPPVEAPPVGYVPSIRKTMIKSVKIAPDAKNEEVVVEGYQTKKSEPTIENEVAKEVEEVIVQGYAKKSGEPITVKGYSIKSNEPITVKGYKSKSLQPIKVQGYQIKQGNSKSVEGNPTKNDISSSSNKKVSVYPSIDGAKEIGDISKKYTGEKSSIYPKKYVDLGVSKRAGVYYSIGAK